MVESCVKSNEEAKKLEENRPRRLAQLFLDYYLFFAPPCYFRDLPVRESEEFRVCVREVVVSRCSIRPSWAARVVGGATRSSKLIATSNIYC